MKNNIYQHKQLQERQSASPALTSSAPAKSDELSSSKLSVACRGEKTLDSGRMNVIKHTIFALRKGLIIGTSRGRIGQLCGMDRGSFRYRDSLNKRQTVKQLSWISSSFKGKECSSPPQGKPCGSRRT